MGHVDMIYTYRTLCKAGSSEKLRKAGEKERGEKKEKAQDLFMYAFSFTKEKCISFTEKFPLYLIGHKSEMDTLRTRKTGKANFIFSCFYFVKGTQEKHFGEWYWI